MTEKRASANVKAAIAELINEHHIGDSTAEIIGPTLERHFGDMAGERGCEAQRSPVTAAIDGYLGNRALVVKALHDSRRFSCSWGGLRGYEEKCGSEIAALDAIVREILLASGQMDIGNLSDPGTEDAPC